MKSLSHLIVGILMAATIFLSAACEHRDLCYDHSHWTDLKVEFDWSEAPDATPHTMVVYLFPRDGSLPRRYEITDVKNGTKVRVPSGEFDASLSTEIPRLLRTGNHLCQLRGDHRQRVVACSDGA